MKHLKSLAVLVLLCTFTLEAKITPKDADDVYALCLTLKNRVLHLTGEKGIQKEFLEVPKQVDKEPRHVMQKSLEVLAKINKYRIDNGLGAVNVPPFPSREITEEDVYFNVRRLNDEVVVLLKKINCPHIASLESKERSHSKTSNDTYRELWIASLAFDELLGKGFTPTDSYERSAQIVKIVDHLRRSQNIFTPVEMPAKKSRKHPNHVLYATHELMGKISDAEKKLWMEPLEIPQNPQTVITPTEVYDSMQIVIAELKRIRRRLGLERDFEVEALKENKTPSDSLQNIEYAIAMFPDFSFSRKIVQYDRESLTKTYNDVYALSEFILKKINYLKEYRGIKVQPKTTIHLQGLESMHVYQKAIETMEKISKMRKKEGLYDVAIPKSPHREVSSDNVYELLIMIDDEISIIMEKNGIANVKRWSYVIEKSVYADKTPSDAYYNLWKISSLIDAYMGSEYSANEIYQLAGNIDKRVDIITGYLGTRTAHSSRVQKVDYHLDDVLSEALAFYHTVSEVQKRANMYKAHIVIPKEKEVTSDTVYNALRILNAALIESAIYFGVEPTIPEDEPVQEDKTPSDVYALVFQAHEKLKQILEDGSYAK